MQLDWWLQPCAGFDNSWHNYAQGSNWEKAGAGMKIIPIPVPFIRPVFPPKPLPQRRNQIKISEGVNWGQSPNRGREAPEITPENWGRSLNREPEAPKNWGKSPSHFLESDGCIVDQYFLFWFRPITLCHHWKGKEKLRITVTLCRTIYQKAGSSVPFSCKATVPIF